jgi:diguanylate cyclase (GGDEF)-like protein
MNAMATLARPAAQEVDRDLAALLRESAGAVVSQWSQDLKTGDSPGYAEQPLAELEADCRQCLDGYEAAIGTGDYSKIRRFIDHEVRARVNQGFRSSEVARKFLAAEPVIWPLVIHRFADAERLAAALWRVRTCVTNAVSEFTDQYERASQQRVDAYVAEMEQMNRRLEELSVRDPLTGLYNRRYFQDRLANEFQRAQRHDRPLAVLMVDIDFFKSVNDTYGHQVGDEVLRSVALLMVNQTRATDITARYGGEEFIAVLPETDHGGALRVAEKLRESVAVAPLHRIETEGGEAFSIHCTVSIGIAGYKAGMTDPAMLIHEADRALYMAKGSGRNRAIAAWDLEPAVPGAVMRPRHKSAG